MLKPLFALILGLIICSTFLPQSYALGSLDRILISSERLLDASGTAVFGHVNINKQIHVSADILNGQDTVQQFVYIVQIRNSENIIVSFTWFSASLNPTQSLSPAISWKPNVAGVYTAEIFVWESFENMDALSEMSTLEITVS